MPGHSWADIVHPIILRCVGRNGMTAYIRGRHLRLNIGCAIRRNGIAVHQPRGPYGTLPERSSSGPEPHQHYDHAQPAVLEEQIKERMGELLDSDTKLKEEMWEKIWHARNRMNRTSR